MRILVCGDRNWANRDFLYGYLSGLTKNYPFDQIVIIEGEARGADKMARDWAELFGAPFEPYPAQWNKYGRGAGPIRNQQMLTEGKPDLVVAFHNDIANSKGTGDMVRRARKAGIKVEVITE